MDLFQESKSKTDLFQEFGAVELPLLITGWQLSHPERGDQAILLTEAHPQILHRQGEFLQSAILNAL